MYNLENVRDKHLNELKKVR